MSLVFEQTGWSHIDISNPALDQVVERLRNSGIDPEDFSVRPHLAGFKSYLQLPAYSGEYRTYGGKDSHCLLEKSLEHYLSLVLVEPRAGNVAVDIGSCKSVVPEILRSVYGVKCYEQDLVYPSGVNGDRIGSGADAIPLPDSSVDFMMLHCTFEHFEGNADTGFIHECARLLKPGGQVVVLPLYLNANYCNITGETDAARQTSITFDPDARYRCLIPEWQNRFGRHYSPEALINRVINPGRISGLHCRLMRVREWERAHPSLWLRWILLLSK